MRLLPLDGWFAALYQMRGLTLLSLHPTSKRKRSVRCQVGARPLARS